MVDDCGARDFAPSVDQLNDVRRKSGLEQDLDEDGAGVRDIFGRLEDARITAYQVGIASGKLNGVMIPATPIGRRKLIAHLLRNSLGTV
jgi:hypothetical protein